MEHKDLEIVKNTTRIYELIIKNKETRIVDDITGWAVYFIAKENMKDSDTGAPIYKKVTSHVDAVNGETKITLTPTDTDITAGNYYYAISYKDDEGNEEVLYWGKLKISETVHKNRA